MLLTLWFLWMRLRWALWPLPRTMIARDRVIADRAARVLDQHLQTIPTRTAPSAVGPHVPGGWAYTLDPYRTMGPKYVGATPAIELVLMRAIDRARWVLSKHSLPQHLMTALLRDRDPESIANSKKVEADVKAEAAAEKAARANKPQMVPPAMPSPNAPPHVTDLRPKSSGAGGSKGTP